MTASATITDDQIRQIYDRLTAELYKSDLPAEMVQIVLSAFGSKVIEEMVSVLRRWVSKMVVREVEVDYDSPLLEAIRSTHRTEYLNDEVVKFAPRNGRQGKKKVKVYLFPLEMTYSVGDVDTLMKDLGLLPDPYALSAIYKDDCKNHSISEAGTQWQDDNGHHCYLSFQEGNKDRRVYCDFGECSWYEGWLISGIHEQSSGV